MKKSASLDTALKPVASFLQRYHLVIFVLVVAGSLALAIFSLHRVVNVNADSEIVAPQSSFDTETMERIENLQTRENASGELDLPDGRTNPLYE